MNARQRGFSIITAIFLIVVLAAFGAFAVSMFRVQQASAALDELGSRAYQAAQAGIEWGAWQVLRGPGTCAAATGNLALPGSLSGFTATVTCASTSHTEAGNPVTIYQLTATACNQPAAGACPNPAPGPDYVERQVQGAMER
ncbi:MAG: agglutinin biogenesis protein MshP [Rhodocyclales bacterium]|nr:MAG: agglutinin biogenesis protein MshP [Rhodocyclales bacterium]